MRVIFVSHNYPRYAGDLPGAFLHPLTMALKDRGHDVRVVAPSDQGRGGRDTLQGIPVRRVRYSTPEREVLAYTGRMQDAIKSAGGLMALRGLIKGMAEGAMAEAEGAKGKAVVHAHWWIPAGIAAPRELPLVLTLHGTDGRLLQKSFSARWLGRPVLRRADVVTTVSRHLAEVIERTTGREDVTDHVQAMPIVGDGRPWSTGGGGAIVVCRLTPQKRVDLALRAVAEVDRQLPLTVVGDGPERPMLEALAGSLSGARVTFAGQVPSTEVAQRLAAADVMLFPAVEEGLGLAAVEALMAGVPVVVCNDGGGVVGAVQQHGGGVVTAPTPDAIAAGIREALRPDKRNEAISAGKVWRELLSPDRVAARFEQWYQDALESSDSRKEGARL